MYIGLNNGQLLRYDFRNENIDLLCCHSSNCITQESFDQDTNTNSNDQTDEELAGISSMTAVQSGTSLLLIIGGQVCILIIGLGFERFLYFLGIAELECFWCVCA